MRVKQYKGTIYGADLTAKERRAMNIEINRQIVEADRKYLNNVDAMILYFLHKHLGFGKKRQEIGVDVAAWNDEKKEAVTQ